MRALAAVLTLSAALGLAACQTTQDVADDARASDSTRAETLEANGRATLNALYAEVPSARDLASLADGILVFPNVVKAGLGVGGETGNGVLFVGGEPTGYYNKSGASFGFQAGAQSRSEVIMFLTDEALTTFQESSGFEFGVDASAAVLDVGAGAMIDTGNITSDVVAIIFGETGLMANASLEGSKVTELDLE